ncbi:GNAT family N-acetyltransferase [Sphingosinicella sp. LY1275]|uniref:GNAT family N-acetyltransferase n=1 Tax=Sphingosinicella sp. LY1275 TaxID=3095379 RepID=UPI002ADEC1B2|nr:GNAT family N-acetyltransferase [Sphingosinicella sp. LY1275]MEA1012967.1 GNAT family N-acetyltransferase [Sphingosinicella sp. LY1275]
MRAAPALPIVAEPCARAPAVDGFVVRECIVRTVPEELAGEWQALADVAAEPNCFAEPWFVAAGLRNLAENEIRLVEVREAGRLIGVLPLCGARDYGRMRVAHVENWQHYHDFLGTPLVRAGAEQAFWSAILGHLDGADWAPAFFHMSGLVEDGPVHHGLEAAARALGRGCPLVHRTVRAELASSLSPAAYYENHVRKKKRKELKRLQNRLAELGAVSCRSLGGGADVGAWIDQFLALERAGWKGAAGSALGCTPATEAFFREAVTGAAAAGRLDFLRLDLDGRPIAMLVNFLTPPGAFSFKIAFDEAFARFSPGVLIQLENLRVLARGDIAWMDSCAAEHHPMIDSLWGERRSVVRVTIRLAGIRRGLIYYGCRALELASAGRWAALKALATVMALEEVA